MLPLPMSDFTLDPHRLSWVPAANETAADFPLTSLPFAIFTPAAGGTASVGVGIGDQILDLRALAAAKLLAPQSHPGLTAACHADTLNPLLGLGPAAWADLRRQLSRLLGADTCPVGPTRDQVAACLRPLAGLHFELPARVGDYTDFYASIDHAARVGALFRPEQPLLPNYKWIPIGYHGRSSSLVPSGSAIRRPHGQRRPPGLDSPIFGATEQLDYELELGALVGPGNGLGETIPLARAGEHLFGVCLLNDWSARDLQSWEYQPLGPFLAKNFATTLSPWVLPLAALEPFRVPARSRAAGDPAPLPYLADVTDAAHGGLDLTLEVYLQTATMRATGAAPHRLSRGNARTLYWTFGQLLVHHASNGCNLRPGDLLGSGTVSGPEADSCGCLLELTERGARPFVLPNGETRAFLADGDEVILRGYAERAGFRRISLGECRGRILPAT